MSGPTAQVIELRPRRPRGRPAVTALLALAVGVAFADSSIVVIALPEMLGTFDTTIPRVSWVITAYNLAVAVVALALVPLVRRLDPVWTTRAGLLLFSAACVACAAAGTLGILVGARTVQGIGAALLLAGAVPLLVAATGGAGAGTRVWGAAAIVGAAVGPALGGILTQAFDWRAIFIAQIPVALIALLATTGTAPGHAAAATPGGPPAAGAAFRRHRAAAGIALGLISAALVGALFLASVLVIDGWGHAPLTAAGVVSALPLGAVLIAPVARRCRPMVAMAGGIATLAGSLVAMGLVRESDIATLTIALLLCGLGMGLAMPALTRRSLAGADATASGSWSVGARHAGLVLGLVLMAPLLASSLTAVSDRAELVGAAHLVDAPLSIDAKIAVGRALQSALEATPNGSVPDLRAAAAAGGDADEPARAALGTQLHDLVAPAITRGFRPSFLLCALLGLLALAPLAALRGPPP